MRPFITAIRTLTLLPVPGRDSASLAAALPFFPAVGVLIGALVVLVLYGASLTGWITGAGVLAMIAAVWITRGLHVDGLADLTDALGAGRTRERRLEIMKDPHTGAFGVMAIMADLLLKSVALSHLASLGQWSLALVPFIVSRTAQVMLAVTLPYARAEGGKAAAFVQEARPFHLVLALAAATAFCLAATGLTGLILLLQGLVAAFLLRLWMKHHFGGVTGDLLGASNELIETGLLAFTAFIATTGS
ncbi:MAG: adenosylcobinamide-GDP ribazoletransferase [bacterium]